MAFASTQTGQSVFGNLKAHYGTYSQASGDTGGAIATGLTSVHHFHATAATVVSDSDGTVTITTADPGTDASGYWMALGY